MAELHDPVVKRRSAWGRGLAILCVIAGLSAVGFSQVRQTQLTHDLERESNLRSAGQCVAQYERVDQLEQLGAFIIRTNAETLISLAIEPDPEAQRRIMQFRALVEGDIKEAQEIVDVVNPCDLGDAKRLLAEEG